VNPLRFNFTRPLLIIAVAFFSNTLTETILLSVGTEETKASNIAYAVMIGAAIVTFIILNKQRKKR
jgi:hypothetical protein